SAEKELDAGKARHDQRCQQGRRSRNGRDRDAFIQSSAHKLIARIRDQGGTGVAGKSYRLAIQQRLDQSGSDPLGVVVMIGNQRTLDTMTAQQTTRDAAVFTGYEISTAQDVQRPQGDIRQIADWSRK